MKKILILLFLLFPALALAATVTPPGDIRVERNNLLPTSTLVTTFSNATTGTSEAYGLAGAKISCHTWTIDSDKVTADVSWTIALQGSMDNELWADLDSTTSVADWKRDIVNKSANWVRSSVLRSYTSTAPNITIKFQSGCN